jgi:hypothetical protein
LDSSCGSCASFRIAGYDDACQRKCVCYGEKAVRDTPSSLVSLASGLCPASACGARASAGAGVLAPAQEGGGFAWDLGSVRAAFDEAEPICLDERPNDLSRPRIELSYSGVLAVILF